MLEVIVDTREQRPWSFDAVDDVFVGERKKLETGDYTLASHPDHVSIERKSLNDFVQSITRARPRFNKELGRMRTYPWRAVIVEGSVADIARQSYTSLVAPRTVLAHMVTMMRGQAVPVFLAGSRAEAQILAAAFLRDAAKELG